MPLLVVRDFLRQLSDEVGAFRTRPHKSHLSTQDVPKLRNLIDAHFANDPTHARGSIIIFARPNGASLLRIDTHRAKLQKHKRLPIVTHSLLAIEHGTARVQLDQEGSKQSYRKR